MNSSPEFTFQHTLEIRVDGNSEVGFGHLRRAKTLAAKLCSFTNVKMTGLSPDARRVLGDRETNAEDARIVIFDSPYSIDNQLLEAKERGQITVALDYFGDVAPDINISVYPHKEVRANKAAYIGFEYLLIREDIVAYGRRPFLNQANQVMVCIGGGDLLQQGRLAAGLLHDKGFDVTLIQGPFASNMSASSGYKTFVNPENYAQLFSECNWAVTNGGGCLFEALCLGMPTFVLPQTAAEMKIAQFVEQKGAVLGVGLDHLRAFTLAELQCVVEAGAGLVDGRGAERISEIIRGLL